MDVIGHQAICPDLDARLLRLFGEKIAVYLLIAVLEEDGLAPVAALCYMMRAVGHDDASDARHGAMLWRTPAIA